MLLLASAFHYSAVWGMSLLEQRQAFERMETLLAAKQPVTFPEQARALESYPLYPVLRYQWLRKNLQRGAEIEAFLSDYSYSRHADLLRKEWLQFLFGQQQWQGFIQNYSQSNNSDMMCRYNWALYNTGHRQEALTAAKELWTVGNSQPESCNPLFSRLMDSEYFSQDMIWQRFAKALKRNKDSLAGYIKRLLPGKDQKIADFWLEVHKKPALVADERQWQQPYRQLGLIFAHGIDRLAGSDIDQALAIWDERKHNFKISPQTNDDIERRLGLALVFRKNAAAYSRLSRVQNADANVREWRVRAALLEGDWQHIEQALAGLDENEKQQARWRYWQARMLAETGRKLQSDEAFAHLATNRSLFGFMASARVNKSLQLNDRPIEVTQADMEQFKRLPGIEMVSEFNALGRINDARRQWWFLLGQFDNGQILKAAKLAQQWGWTQTAIFTVAKAEHWDDLGLRFPVDYEETVRHNARRQELDPAIVFGLIRRESVFDQSARSPAGARGLMQIMPQTGRQIARSLKEKWRSVESLFNPAVNVKYGAYYYKQMLDRFDGHFALAAAAYNAGPGRVSRWLPRYSPMAADIWIETIPFKETREYVTAVLEYALIYQQRLKRHAIKIKDLMREIVPE
ncbi:MAG: lytic murein transglycosylase [Gammaproteobacteria bacterium HGW-Gammaproteobacteria-3]|nr:MAG: lytic murein transglycosylase [Gammaproteobacteria bacterium HGW-Gammaproteobacteria-3]